MWEFHAVATAWQDSIPEGQIDVMMYIGGDFAFRNAAAWYAFIDKLIHYVNKQGAVNAMYSTPERFLQAKRSQLSTAQPGAEAGSSISGGTTVAATSTCASTREGQAESRCSARNSRASTGSSSATSMPGSNKTDAGAYLQACSAQQTEDCPGLNGQPTRQHCNGTTWALRQDDFFPYQCEYLMYWTGECTCQSRTCCSCNSLGSLLVTVEPCTCWHLHTITCIRTLVSSAP